MRVRRLWGAALLAVLMSATGCAQAGALGDILGGVTGGGAQGEQLLQGDVMLVDASRQYVQVRATNGQTANVRFDSRTQVVYQNQAYAVTALEAGDEISMRLAQTQQGELYTDQILVTRSIQEIRGNTGNTSSGTRQYQQIQGYVGQVDASRGVFELRSQSGASLWVTLPYNPPAENVTRLRQRRTNQQVRVGGYYISNDRFELASFL